MHPIGLRTAEIESRRRGGFIESVVPKRIGHRPEIDIACVRIAGGGLGARYLQDEIVPPDADLVAGLGHNTGARRFVHDTVQDIEMRLVMDDTPARGPINDHTVQNRRLPLDILRARTVEMEGIAPLGIVVLRWQFFLVRAAHIRKRRILHHDIIIVHEHDMATGVHIATIDRQALLSGRRTDLYRPGHIGGIDVQALRAVGTGMVEAQRIAARMQIGERDNGLAVLHANRRDLEFLIMEPSIIRMGAVRIGMGPLKDDGVPHIPALGLALEHQFRGSGLHILDKGKL